MEFGMVKEEGGRQQQTEDKYCNKYCSIDDQCLGMLLRHPLHQVF